MPVAGLGRAGRALLWVLRWALQYRVLVVALVGLQVLLELATVHTLWMLLSYAKYQVRRKYRTYPALLHKYFFPLLCVFLIYGSFGWFFELPSLYSYHFIHCNLYEAWQSNLGSKVVRGDRKWKMRKDGSQLAHGEDASGDDADQDKVREWFEGHVPAKNPNRWFADLYEVSFWVSCRGNHHKDQHWEGLLEVRCDQRIVVFQLSRRSAAGALTCFKDKAVDKKWPAEREPRTGEHSWAKKGYNTKLWAPLRRYTAAEVRDMLMAGMKEGQKPGGEWEKIPKAGSSSTNCGSYCLRVMIAVLQKAVQGTVYSLLPTPWLMLCMIVGASWRTKNGLGLYLFGVQCAALLPFPMGDFFVNVAYDVERLMKSRSRVNVLRLVDSCLVGYVAVCNLPLMLLMFALSMGLFAVRRVVGLVVNTGR